MSPVYLIILNHNNCDIIAGLLNSIITDNSYPFYLILIDNGSIDESLKFLKKMKQDNIELIKLKYNLGTTIGWNIGIKKALSYSAEYIGFVNSDILVLPYWLLKIMKVFEIDKKIGAVSNQLRCMTNRNFIQNDGADLNNPFHYRMGFVGSFKQYENPIKVPYIHLGCTIFKSSVFKNIGLFDENMFIYSSDFDIQIRMRLAGYDLYHCPTSIAYHKSFHTCSQLNKNEKYKQIMKQDGIYFYRKWKSNIIDNFKKLNDMSIINNNLIELHGEKVLEEYERYF